MTTASFQEKAGIHCVNPEEVESFQTEISERLERLVFELAYEKSVEEFSKQDFLEVSEKKTVRAVEPVEVRHLHVSGPSL